ncbi:MAG: hypothetical protein ACOX9R_00965 [Armatimonadota bacterium]
MRYGITPGPTKAEADALVALPKFMKRKPRERVINATRRLKSDYIYDSAGRQIGITIDVHISEPRNPGDTVSAALIWRGCPIRRIDWKVVEQFPDGTVVEGWHEHLWDEECEDRVGRPFGPPVDGWDHLETMFVSVCHHWKITVVTRQDRPLRVVSDNEDTN